MSGKPTILLISGGTGGHVFPALSVAETLHGRGSQVVLITDQRGDIFQGRMEFHTVFSLPIHRGKGIFAPVIMGASLIRATLQALKIIRALKPASVIGFGGYPSLSGIVAARFLRKNIILHEQNAILGRVNRWMARKAKRLALSFPDTLHVPKGIPVVVTGNPVRQQILAQQNTPYSLPKASQPLRILVIGGSQGARIFSYVVPEAIKQLPSAMQQRLSIVQQCRPELQEQTVKAYKQTNLKNAQVEPFFHNIEDQLRKAHMVICRCGASTLSELMVMGRPAIMVPYAAAADNHQYYNARQLAEAGAGYLMLETDFIASRLRDLFLSILHDSTILIKKSAEMKKFSQLEAATKLADLAESLLPKK